MPFSRPWAHFPGFTVSKTVDRALRPMLVVRKNGDEFLKKIRIRFLSVDHRLSVTKTK